MLIGNLDFFFHELPIRGLFCKAFLCDSLFYCFKNDPIDFYLLFLFMFLFSNKFIFPISTLLYFFFKLHFPCFALFFLSYFSYIFYFSPFTSLIFIIFSFFFFTFFPLLTVLMCFFSLPFFSFASAFDLILVLFLLV